MRCLMHNRLTSIIIVFFISNIASFWPAGLLNFLRIFVYIYVALKHLVPICILYFEYFVTLLLIFFVCVSLSVSQSLSSVIFL